MDTRERLIESTRALLWDRGLDGTSPKDILREAGVGQGSMYHHFRGKHDLARAAVERSAQELRTALDHRLGAPGHAVERITACLRRQRGVLRGCPLGGLTQDPHVMGDPELLRPIKETFDWLQHRLAAVLAESQADGELDAELDPVATAASIVAVMQGGYVLARAAQDESRFDRAAAGILRLLGKAETGAGADL